MHSTSVDQVWLKKDIKKRAEATRKMLAEEKENKEKAERFKTVSFDTLDPVIGGPDTDTELSQNCNDADFNLPRLPSSRLKPPCVPATRSRSSATPTPTASSPKFPRIPLRFGRRTLNTKVMTAAVHITSKYDISFTTVIKAGCDWANLVFGQEWTV